MASTTAETSHIISNLHLGADADGVDLKVFGDTSSAYMLWDASANNLLFTGAAGLSYGTLSSDDQTGITLSSSNPTVLDVFADDNDTALTNAVYHAIRGRTMLFKTPTEGSIFSVMGQIKCADEVDFNPGVFAGVRGYIETMDDTDIKSGAKMWAVEGCLDATLASYTVKDGGISAAFHAELTGVGTFTQDSGGILAGLYVDETAGTGKWGYGIYMTAGSCHQPMKIGALSSTTAGTGAALTSTYPILVEVHGDDVDTAMGSSTTARCIDARMMNYNSPKAETWGIQGKSKIGALAKTANVSAGVVGAMETYGTCSLATGSGNTFIAGVMGRLGMASGLTLGAGTFACGVLAFYNTLAANDPTGEYTVAYMATASDIAGTGDWDYGVYIEDTTQAWYSTTTHTGAGTTTRNAMEVAVTDNATNTGNYQRGIYCNYTAAGDKTSGGEVNVFAYDLTLTGDTVYAYGYVNYIGSSGNPTLSFVAPISIYVDDLGNACGGLVGIDIGFAGTNSPAGRHAYFRCRQHSSAIPQTVLLLEGSSCADYLLEATTSSMPPFDVGTGASSNCIGHIAVRFQNSGGLTRYLRLYESAS